MKKIIFILSFFLLFSVSVQSDEIYSAADGVDTSGAELIYPEFRFEDITEAMKTGGEINIYSLFNGIVNVVKDEFSASLKTACIIIAIATIYGLTSNESSGNASGKKAVFFCCYLAICGLVCANYLTLATGVGNAVQSVKIFMSAAIPSLAVLTVASGGAISAATLYTPIMLSGTASAYLFSGIALPMLNASLGVGIAGNLSERFSLKGISTGLKRCALVLACGSMTVFCAVVSASGFAAGGMSDAANKAARFAVQNSLPVLGGILADATDTVASSGRIIKNAGGAAGIMLIMLLMLYPFLKVGTAALVYRISAAVCQTVAGKGISGILEQTADILGVLCSCVAAFGAVTVIFIAILIKAGGG